MKPPSAKQLRFIDGLRAELDLGGSVPASSSEAARIIDNLLGRKAAEQRRLEREAAARQPPSISMTESILGIARRLGIEMEVPPTSREATLLYEDLRIRERQARRTADGSAS
jgi:hypothetical protein